MKKLYQIAIDGFSSCGKSTLAKALAKTLHAFASWQGLNNVAIDWADSDALRLNLQDHLESTQP